MARTVGLAVVFLLLMVGGTTAQENTGSVWKPNADATIEYNCGTFATLMDAIDTADTVNINDIGRMALARLVDGTEISVAEYTGSAALALLT